MGHAAIVQAVCIHERRLEIGAETPEGIALLATAAMSRDPCGRPSFEDILEILEPLGAALAAAAADAAAAAAAEPTAAGGTGAGGAAA